MKSFLKSLCPVVALCLSTILLAAEENTPRIDRITVAPQGSGAGGLAIGMPAPPIRFMHWIKGEPVHDFVKGKVYVVEFWATWCVPCRRGMAHLTELAKTYAGKAIIVGVNVRQTEEADGSVKTVEKFVRENASKMGYRVAMDDPTKNTVFNDWMTASGRHMIPTAFVVDKKGRIAWIGTGYPLPGLDEAISDTLGIRTAPAKAKGFPRPKRAQEQVRPGVGALVGH